MVAVSSFSWNHFEIERRIRNRNTSSIFSTTRDISAIPKHNTEERLPDLVKGVCEKTPKEDAYDMVADPQQSSESLVLQNEWLASDFYTAAINTKTLPTKSSRKD